MAKVEMKKIEIIALLSDSKRLIERLQRRGVVEFCDIKDERLVKMNTASNLATFEKHLAAVLSAREILARYAPQKQPLLAGLSGRKEIDKHDFGKTVNDVDDYLKCCYDIIELDKKTAAATASIGKNEARLDALLPWRDLDVDLDFSGTRETACLIGSLESREESGEYIQSLTEADVSVVEISRFGNKVNFAVLCHKDDREELLLRLREAGFTPPPETGSYTPAERIAEYEKRIAAQRETVEKCTQSIKAYSGVEPQMDFAEDYFRLRSDKYEAIGKMGLTQNTFIIEGWIPADCAYKIQAEFEKKFVTAIRVYEPDEDEEAPVLMRNNAFAQPVEGITEMYALPTRSDVDPNPVMSFFYYLFFGMMLSDAGYGLLMTVATWIVLKKTTVEGTLRRSLVMFRNCGISTLFWGALFGSWFGDAPQVIARQFGKEIGSTALWFEPISDPIKLLLFSFLLGIIHLFVGLGVLFYKNWKQGRKADAFCDSIPIMLTVGGVAPAGAGIFINTVPANISKIGLIVSAVGVVLLILTAGRSGKNIFSKLFGGVYALYNTATGYLGDILSYSRLLALGLATGSIASVINLVCGMMENPIVKILLFIVVFPIGHIANMAINLLGAYVHTARLQFVEFFSKFYEGGGRAFAPLTVNTKHLKFKEEIINE
ncbi:MAG: V-type ATP synthase subunit I [Clostridia bacterium]|nr:V-type ATP synthase subunit I [Clostridia bacterium]